MQKSWTAKTRRSDPVRSQPTLSLGRYWILRKDLNQIQELQGHLRSTVSPLQMFPCSSLQKEFLVGCQSHTGQMNPQKQMGSSFQGDGIWSHPASGWPYSHWSPPKLESYCTGNLRWLLVLIVPPHFFLEASRKFPVVPWTFLEIVILYGNTQCSFLASSGSCPSPCHNTSLPVSMMTICPCGWEAKTNMIIRLSSECWQHPWCGMSRQPKPLCQVQFPGDCAETAKGERKVYAFEWETYFHQHRFPPPQFSNTRSY